MFRHGGAIFGLELVCSGVCRILRRSGGFLVGWLRETRGLKTGYLPLAGGQVLVDPGVAIVALHRDVIAGSLNLGARGDDGNRADELYLHLTEIEFCDGDSAGAD